MVERPPQSVVLASNRHLETIAAALALPYVERELKELRRVRSESLHLPNVRDDLDARIKRLRMREKQLRDLLLAPETL